MSHYDYVMCPDGRKRKIFDADDIRRILEDWADYIEKNWLTPQRKMFDPESKVKFMLDGLANIILRPNMSGLITEYQKMKTARYEIPISSCESILDDELYSRRSTRDNGEERERIKEMFDELARRYDEAKAARTKKVPKPKKKFPPTRMQKIERARRERGIVEFLFSTVDTNNEFELDGVTHTVCAEQYAPTITADGEPYYAMDKIMCGRTLDGECFFFDMNIEDITKEVR